MSEFPALIKNISTKYVFIPQMLSQWRGGGEWLFYFILTQKLSEKIIIFHPKQLCLFWWHEEKKLYKFSFWRLFLAVTGRYLHIFKKEFIFKVPMIFCIWKPCCARTKMSIFFRFELLLDRNLCRFSKIPLKSAKSLHPTGGVSWPGAGGGGDGQGGGAEGSAREAPHHLCGRTFRLSLK